MKVKEFLQKYAAEILVFFIGSFFGIFIMFSSFEKKENILLISTKAWSDFASHIPLIRSFSLGFNFPPEYSLFPGEVIKYHFGFYFGVGLLEKLGLPIDLALNIPSVISFILLVFVIFVIAKLLFKSKTVGVLSVIFFIFNSSLSYVYYFNNNPFSLISLNNIPNIDNFQSFAPYGDGIVSAFWNLNIYTNQRHLPISFALSLIIIFFVLRPLFTNKKVDFRISILLGIILGLSFFLHFAVLLMTGIAILFLGILFSKLRKGSFITLLVAGIIALPQYLYLNSSEGFNILINPGYLVANNLTFFNFFEFWIYNLGISLILIPIGFIFANSIQRKILLSFISLFIIGNIFQFSPEIAANHKFFNYFMLIGNMFSAYSLVILWRKKYIFKPIVIVLTFFMIFGGIIDFFPIYNDHKSGIPDYEVNEKSQWILENTNPNAVFLNTTYLYNPASLAGRKIFFGWPYFAWSQGYDTEKRGKILKEILGSTDKKIVCSLLSQNEIDFVEIKIEKKLNPDIPPISKIWENAFISSYEMQSENYTIYSVTQNCN